MKRNHCGKMIPGSRTREPWGKYAPSSSLVGRRRRSKKERKQKNKKEEKQSINPRQDQTIKKAGVDRNATLTFHGPFPCPGTYIDILLAACDALRYDAYFWMVVVLGEGRGEWAVSHTRSHLTRKCSCCCIESIDRPLTVKKYVYSV